MKVNDGIKLAYDGTSILLNLRFSRDKHIRP